MRDDLAPRESDPDIREVADALVGQLDCSDELSAWALVQTQDGLAFMILLIRDGSVPPRILFGAHRSGERSLPDRIVLDGLDCSAVARGLAGALGRAVQRGEASTGSRLRLIATGTPTEGPRDVDCQGVLTGAIGTGASRTNIS